MQKIRRSWLDAATIFFIQIYRNQLSSLMLDSCRFSPSCSEYAIECVRRFGVLRGSWRIARRLARCQPFSRWGFDPVR